MVDTIKFSQMTNAGDIKNNDIVPSLRSGQNVTLNNPWTFLAPGSTAQRPAPSSTINYRLRFNTDQQLYEYYDAVLLLWTQLQESASTAGPFVTYTASAGLPDAQNLGALANGILKQTISAGIATLNIAVNGTDYYGPGFTGYFQSPAGVRDVSSNKVIEFISAGVSPAAPNYLQVANNFAGSSPSISAAGTDTNINLIANTKGTGYLNVNTQANTTPSVVITSGAGSVHTTQLIFPTSASTTSVTFQNSSGTVAYLSDIPGLVPSALTASPDTNVTITLGGTPATALLQPASITIGWTGTLSPSRGGLGTGSAPTDGQVPAGSGGNYTPTSIGSGTGITVSLSAGSIGVALASISTLNLLANLTGGSAAPTPHTLSEIIDACIGSVQGDILYRSATSWSALAPGTSGYFLQTQGAAANPQWALPVDSGSVTAGTQNQLAWYAATGSTVSGLSTANNSVLITNGSGVPALSVQLPPSITAVNMILETPTIRGDHAFTVATFSDAPLTTDSFSFAAGASNAAFIQLVSLTANGSFSVLGKGTGGVVIGSSGATTTPLSLSNSTNTFAVNIPTWTGNRSLTLPDANVTLVSGTMLANALTSAHIFVGNGSNIATDVAMSGDATLANTGAITVSSIGGKAVTLGGAFTMSGAFTFTGTVTGNTSVTFPTSGTLATTSQLPSPASPLPLISGGTNSSLLASNGGIVYSNASQITILSGTPTAGQIILSGASSAPSWSTATYPATAGTSGNFLKSDGTNWISTALGTGVATALSVNIGSAGAFVTFNGALGTPSSGTLTNATGLPIGGITGLGTGVATALAAAVTGSGGIVLETGATLTNPQATSLNFGTSAVDGIRGVTGGTSASAGVVGEYVEVVVPIASAVSLTTATSTNVTNLSLTAGDWDFYGTVGFVLGGGATVTLEIGGTSTVSATFGAETQTQISQATNAGNFTENVPSYRFNVSSTTTIYLVVNCSFAAGSVAAYGRMSFRRRR